MKIIQITDWDSNIYGLADDGELYFYEHFRQPRAELYREGFTTRKTVYANQADALARIKYHLENGGDITFHPGQTGGWAKLPTGPRGENVQIHWPDEITAKQP